MKDCYKIITGNQITKDLIRQINILDKNFFEDEYLWEYEYQLSLFEKNKNSFVMVVKGEELVGYINYLVISEEKYMQMIKSETTVDRFAVEEVLPFSKQKGNYITINSVVISKDFQDGEVIRLLATNFKKVITSIDEAGCKIKGMNSFAVSEHGEKLLDRWGFKKYKAMKDGSCLYILEGEPLRDYLCGV